MMLRKLALAAAMVGLMTAPVVHARSSLPASEPIAASSELGGGSLGSGNTLFFILGIAAIVAAVVLLSENEDAASV